ncbi:MAG: transcriptional activator NhaR [Acidobacteria bacterium]|nr:transcriptional activator NhaR [Acidobacteriota bacterium]
MEWLNYHHLYYFWMVAREGTITRACARLSLAQPTVSGQLRLFEETLGEKLFMKTGRTLSLTDTGQVVYRYADEIFSVGQELQDVLRGRPRGRAVKFVVGISDVVPKWIAFRVLKPALEMKEAVQLVCHEDDTQALLTRLAAHQLDMVLADAPITAPFRARAFNHDLGSCGVSFCATSEMSLRYRRGFPGSLDGAPFLMPVEGATLRRSLEQWFDRHGIRPRIAAEFQDSALLKVFGQSGAGVFAVPSAVEKDVREHYGSSVIGRTAEIKERFYAISMERRLKHPAVVEVTEAARQLLDDVSAG